MVKEELNTKFSAKVGSKSNKEKVSPIIKYIQGYSIFIIFSKKLEFYKDSSISLSSTSEEVYFKTIKAYIYIILVKNTSIINLQDYNLFSFSKTIEPMKYVQMKLRSWFFKKLSLLIMNKLL